MCSSEHRLLRMWAPWPATSLPRSLDLLIHSDRINDYYKVMQRHSTTEDYEKKIMEAQFPSPFLTLRAFLWFCPLYSSLLPRLVFIASKWHVFQSEVNKRMIKTVIVLTLIAVRCLQSRQLGWPPSPLISLGRSSIWHSFSDTIFSFTEQWPPFLHFDPCLPHCKPCPRSFYNPPNWWLLVEVDHFDRSVLRPDASASWSNRACYSYKTPFLSDSI